MTQFGSRSTPGAFRTHIEIKAVDIVEDAPKIEEPNTSHPARLPQTSGLDHTECGQMVKFRARQPRIVLMPLPRGAHPHGQRAISVLKEFGCGGRQLLSRWADVIGVT